MAINSYSPITMRGLCIYNVQKVLPAVYDDSLSYYEILCKVQDKLNELVDDANNLNEWQAAQDQVMQELTDVVNDFINGGYKEGFDEFVGAWLQENIENLFDEWSQMVFFGLTNDGYFTAFVPQKWSFSLGTIMDYGDENYGSLTIKY